MAKVVHLTSVHPAFDVRIFHKECRALAAAGHQVTLVAPHGADELRDGIQVRAVRKANNRFQRTTSTVWAVFRAALREKADIYHFHDPELMPVGLALKLLGKTVVYDVHESYRDTLLSKHWLPSIARMGSSRAIAALEWVVSRSCDAVVTATPRIAGMFPAKKSWPVRNFPDLRAFAKHTAENVKAEKKNDVAYAGAISLERGAREMVQAIALVPEDLDARLIIAGPFPPALEQELKTLPGWSRTVLLGRMPHEKVIDVLQGCRAGLCVLHATPNHLEALPIKMFEYMAAGIPVVASSFARWQEIVGPAQCGLLVDPMSPEQIANGITQLLRDPDAAARMGRNGQRAAFEKYSWDTEAALLVKIYDALLKKSGAAPEGNPSQESSRVAAEEEVVTR
ncbi:MAG: glycosyltransferase family 4 protein [Candidatus Angelobacter sp.]